MSHVKIEYDGAFADAGYMQVLPKLLRRCMIRTLVLAAIRMIRTLVLAAILVQLSPTYARLICAGYTHQFHACTHELARQHPRKHTPTAAAAQ